MEPYESSPRLSKRTRLGPGGSAVSLRWCGFACAPFRLSHHHRRRGVDIARLHLICSCIDARTVDFCSRISSGPRGFAAVLLLSNGREAHLLFRFSPPHSIRDCPDAFSGYPILVGSYSDRFGSLSRRNSPLNS